MRGDYCLKAISKGFHDIEYNPRSLSGFFLPVEILSPSYGEPQK
jgi:hypothetical protein